jgi:hypothetical protein
VQIQQQRNRLEYYPEFQGQDLVGSWMAAAAQQQGHKIKVEPGGQGGSDGEF